MKNSVLLLILFFPCTFSFAATYVNTSGLTVTIETNSGSIHPYAGTDLQPSVMIGNNLYLSNANLQYANLQYADIYDTAFDNVNLKFSNLQNASFTHSSLASANLRNADIRSARFYYDDGITIGPSVGLQGADLTNADLRNATLYNADLNNATLHNADLRYAVFKERVDDWINETDLYNADFTNADLRFADLVGTVNAGNAASWSGTKLYGAALPGGTYDQTWFESQGATFAVPEPSTYALVVGCLALSSAFFRRRFKP